MGSLKNHQMRIENIFKTNLQKETSNFKLFLFTILRI